MKRESQRRIRRVAGWGVTLVVGLLLGTAATHAAPAAAPTAVLEQSELPARGEQQTLLQIPAFGRYTVTAKSSQGTALQLVDRMTGPGRLSGEAGQQDGRLDLFLEQGSYLLRSFADPHGDGEVSLAVQRAQELNPEPAPQLVELRLEQSQLDDLQQRSYWLQVDSRSTLAIEAAGRNLADLRLWRDGNWLVAAEPLAEVTTPQPGRPLESRLLVADLNPGFYLLTAYGGPPQPWAETSAEHPLYLRVGIPALPEAGRRQLVASPFGIDRWRVPAATDFFRLELPEAEPATLAVGSYDPQHPFNEPYRQVDIDKQSLPPVAELRSSGTRREQLLTVRREAGRPYVLQQFEAREFVEITNPGDYWISTLHAGAGEDSVDVTALLAVSTPGQRGWQFVGSTAVALDRQTGWQRRFNLLDEASLFFEVKAQGSYRFQAEGVNAELRIEPFLINPDSNYQAPEFQPARLERDLDPGFYTLTLRPGSREGGKGILTLSAGPVAPENPGLLDSLLQRLNAAMGGEEQGTGRVTAFRRSPVDVGYRQHFRLYLNRQPGVATGLVVRRLPIDLGEPLPVVQAPREHLETRIKIPEAGTLTARDETGRPLSFRIDGGALGGTAQLAAGEHAFALDNSDDRPVSYLLELTPKRLLAGQPLAPPTVVPEPPRFPALAQQADVHYRTERGQTTTVGVRIAEPGLYRLESTGLLQMAGTLRTRTVTRLDAAAANGVGRNFLIAQYLGEGDYQLSAQPQGESRGDLGLRLSRTRLVDGGELREEIVARQSLEAGEGLVYRFHIAAAGDYRLQTLGLGRQVLARLEDAAGWPLLPPGVPADFRRQFAAGDYRLVLLPQPVAARMITRLTPVPQDPEFPGHGPHQVSLDSSVAHRWLEPAGAGERIPDQWTFAVPAAITARIDLGPEMGGELQQDGQRVAQLAGRPWRGELTAGSYLLQATSLRPNNRLDYRLQIESLQLVAGRTRTLHAPADLELAVGADQLCELTSFGDQDVRARLFDATGTLLAQNDDRTDDWNFLVSRPLAAGRYRLRVEPVGTSAATTAVSLRVPAIQEEAPLALPARLTQQDSDLHYYPLPEAREGLWSFAVDSRDRVDLALEEQRDGRWQSVAQSSGDAPQLLVPVPARAGGAFRLRVGSLSRGGHPIILSAERLTPAPQSEARLTGGGMTFVPAGQAAPRLEVAAVDLERPGQFQLAGRVAGLLAGTTPAAALSPVAGGRIAAAGTRLWLARPLAAPSPVKAARLRLTAGAPLALEVAPGTPAVLDLAPPAGSVQLVVASSPIDLPGIRAAAKPRSMAAVGVALRSTALLQTSRGSGQVELWDTGGRAEALPVRLTLYDFPAPPAPVPLGRTPDLRLPPRGSLQLRLPTGDKRLRLALPAGAAARLETGGAPLATFWSDSAPRTLRTESAATTLILYNTAEIETRAGLWLDPAGPAATLGDGGFFKDNLTGAGSRLFSVRLDPATRAAGRRLHLFGPELTVTAVEASGRILRGGELLLHDDAQVLVDHGPGALLAWLSDASGHTQGGGAAGEPLRLPAQVALQGEAMAVRLSAAEPGGLVLRSATPLILRLRGPDGSERLEVASRGVDLTLPLPAGEHTLLLDSPGAAPLGGTLSLGRLAAEPLAEGLGEARLLAPGEARLFRFHLDRPLTIGVGARASVDTVDCALLDDRGATLGRGLVLMRELAAGDYWLRIAAPAGGETVTVQAVLVGLTPPETGPPPEVVRHYLQAAGLQPGPTE